MTDFRTALHGILGTYTPTGSDIANMDWEYIFCGAVFLLCLWFVFSYLRTVIAGIMSRRW